MSNEENTEGKCIYKNLTEGKIRRGVLELSKYFVQDFINLASELPEEEFIVGVGYYSDNQIGISGKLREGEDPKSGASRELYEELSLSIRDEDWKFDIEYATRKGDFHIKELNIRDCVIKEYFPPQATMFKEEGGRKIFILPHGSEVNVRKFLERVNILGNDDDIYRIWAARASDLLPQMRIMKKRMDNNRAEYWGSDVYSI